VGELRSASRALSVPVANDRRSAKSTETTANDLLLHFMARPLWVENYGEFGVTSQFFIEVQPLFTRNTMTFAPNRPMAPTSFAVN
jgi:hypothetical protein